jgi:hypothetical protein
MDDVGFKQRAESQTKDDVTASVVVLTAEEAKAVFDCKLYKKKIQPVWLEITNHTDDEMLFMPRSVDPEYFAPLEVAQKTNWTWSKKANHAKAWFYYEQQIPFLIPPGETISGFVYATRSLGVRWVLVEVFSRHKAVRVEFVHDVPGFKADFHKLGEDEDLYDVLFPGQDIVDFKEAEDFRSWIEAQPATVTNADGTKTGDPLNLVVVGDSEAVWPAFLRSGWDPTAAMTAGSMVKTGAFLAGDDRPDQSRHRQPLHDQELDLDDPPHRSQRGRDPLVAGPGLHPRAGAENLCACRRRRLRFSRCAARQPHRRSVVHRRQPRHHGADQRTHEHDRD